MNTEEYKVKFTIKTQSGFYEQKTESVFLNNKQSHKKAEKIVIRKYNKAPYNQKVTIISVTYC
jgi:hypothetical protein